MIKLKQGYSGEFRCILYDNEQDMNVVQDTGWFDNLITDNGKDLLGNNTSLFTWMCLGSGTNAPDIGDTTLQSFIPGAASVTVGNGNAVRVYAGATSYQYSETRSRRFLAGVGTGTIAELSLGPTNDGTNIFNRSLITPSPIVKAANQVLDVIYRLTIWPPTGDVLVNGLDIDGVLYDTLTRGSEYDGQDGVVDVYTTVTFNSQGWSAYDGEIGATVEDSPAGTSYGSAFESFVPVAYVPGSYQLDVNAVCGINGWNPPLGVRCIKWRTSRAQFQTRFGSQVGDNEVPKDNTKEMSISYRLTWDRH